MWLSKEKIMKNIEWKKLCKRVYSQMGNIYMNCYHYETLTGKSEWQAVVSICGISQYVRRGPFRYSLVKAKMDATRLVEELLIDCHNSITREMRCCRIDPEMI